MLRMRQGSRKPAAAAAAAAAASAKAGVAVPGPKAAPATAAASKPKPAPIVSNDPDDEYVQPRRALTRLRPLTRPAPFGLRRPHSIFPDAGRFDPAQELAAVAAARAAATLAAPSTSLAGRLAGASGWFREDKVLETPSENTRAGPTCPRTA